MTIDRDALSARFTEYFAALEVPAGYVRFLSFNEDEARSLAALLDALDEAEKRIARLEAVDYAQTLGWQYDDDAGAWYDYSAGGPKKPLVCLDEDLVAYTSSALVPTPEPQEPGNG